jgi:hypothetical protein
MHVSTFETLREAGVAAAQLLQKLANAHQSNLAAPPVLDT